MTTRDVRNIDALVAVQGPSERRVANVDLVAAVKNVDSIASFFQFDLMVAQPTKSYWGVWLPDVTRIP